MRVTVHFHFIQPVFYMNKCLLSGNIVYEKGTDSASIIGPCDGTEILLSSCVPYLQFDVFIFDRNGFSTKFNANRYIMCCSCFSFDKLKNHTGFTNSSIANYNELEQVVVRIHYSIAELIIY